MKNKSADSISFNPQENLEIEVYEGLTSEPKYLNSELFYDKKGDRLFQEIMKLPEYYLTRTELEVLQKNKKAILDKMLPSDHFDLVDLGAGDGLKTKVLLKHFTERNINFSYLPIDISENAIKKLSEDVEKEFSKIPVRGISEPFSHALEKLNKYDRKLVLFLGASIGNLTFEESVFFLSRIREKMNDKDSLLIGLDLRKDPQTILAAYNDKNGVTRDFNLNLLERLNRELQANFDLESFQHHPEYDRENGEARSFLYSTKDQIVDLPKIGLKVAFREGEKIRTEISKKYNFSEIQKLALAAGFEVEQHFTDQKIWFTDSLWKVKT